MLIKDKKVILWVIPILILANVLAWIAVFDLSRSPLLEVNFFNVGQGDASFIVTPQNHQILIDGGPDSSILEKLGKTMPFFDRTIDLIVLTHPESDHMRGLLAVLKRYKVENILWTGVVRDTAEYKEWQRLIENEGAKIVIARPGQEVKAGGAVISVLYPFNSVEGQSLKDSNNTSIVARLVFGDNSFLFTGDAHQSVEKELMEKGVNIDSDILKVGHHGSKTSNSEEFVAKVSPIIAAISDGKGNSYGHPNEEVLAILEKYGIRVLRTDTQGDIKIISNGKNIQINNQ